jgi:flagellar secretion chaperone FliS
MTPQSREYQTAAVQSANSVQLVCMLYDTLVGDLNRVIEAMERNDVEARSSEIKHAFLVLEQLDKSLDMERGGDAARNLARFYAVARSRIMEGHGQANPSLFREQIGLFLDVRSAWEQVDPSRRPEPMANSGDAASVAVKKASTSLSCSV